MSSAGRHFQIAVIGGGIAGLMVALGLLRRGFVVKIYERANSFAEIGAGIGFSPNAERAMLALDPRIHTAFRCIATPNTEDWFQYVDGFNESPRGDGEELLFKIYLGSRGFEGCRRADLLAELAKLTPGHCIEFGKELVDIDETFTKEQQTRLSFRNGTTATADLVLGCDGLRSRVRRFVLGSDHPACDPSYSHKFAFRGLIPMDKARAALGDDKSSTRYMHLGPNAHVLTFPVAMGKILNVVAFVTDPAEWSSKDQLTLPATKAEALRSFAGFGPVVTTIMSLLDDDLDKWGIFDLCDTPVPRYVSKAGTVCVLGDAAHAAAPHHGAGAGFAIEDSLALATALEDVAERFDSAPLTSMDKKDAVQAALNAYESVRLERTRWLVETSRFIGDMYEWQVPSCGIDPTKCREEVEERSHRIWDYDIGGMVEETKTFVAAKWATNT